jgi:Tfp pilus assembly protein PilO
MRLINTALISEWQNWVRVLLMVMIGSAAFHFAYRAITKKETE